MYKNYFFLNREITELNQLLIGYKIISIFSQIKNQLLICCHKNDEKIFLEISTNPGDPYIRLKANFSRAKKNTVDVFDIKTNAEIISFEIAQNDRIIRITTDKYSIYFPIRGKYTNIHLIDSKGVQSFKKSGKEITASFEKEIKESNFIFSFRKIDFVNGYKSKNIESIRKDYPIISKDIFVEYKTRTEADNANLNPDKLIEIILNIQNNPIVCYVDEDNYQVKFAVDGFKSLPFTDKKNFENYQKALDYYFSKKRYLNSLQKNKKIIEKYLSKELEYITGKLNNLQGVLQRGEQSEQYKNIADLLLVNLHSIKKGMEEISLKNFDGKIIKIKLDKKIPPQKNIDNYYNRSRGEKIKYEKAKNDFKSANKRLSFLREIEKKFNSAQELNVVEEILTELNLQKKGKINIIDTMETKFRKYIIDDKYSVYVGKDGKSNDLLTTKFAKQNDIWFHVRGLPGSHVVLKISDTKTKPPKSIIKIAATVAAFHSKAKTAGLVPVSYSQKKYIIKKKGMAPGKVLMLKEETVLVRPEIPKNCVLISQTN